ncbi:MAG: RNB domain-containing ribonuclease [Oligoflexia bacterium]|nr:RNB domain-containing ribonuclease [Oligoflexia bacterium]
MFGFKARLRQHHGTSREALPNREFLTRIVDQELKQLRVKGLEGFDVRLDHRRRRLTVSLVTTQFVPEFKLKQIYSKLERALEPLTIRVRFERTDEASVRPGSEEFKLGSRLDRRMLQRDALKSLPVGIEVLRTELYRLPLGRGAVNFVLFKLYVPPEQEQHLREWQSAFERRHGMRVYVQRAEARESLSDLLRSAAGSDKLLTTDELPLIDHYMQGMGRPPPVDNELAKAAQIPKGLKDRTADSFVTIDPKSTRDMEDAICAEELGHNRIKLSVAFTDVTWFLDPGSALDLYAQRQGATIYGSRRALPTLGSQLAYGPASFAENEPRVAWIADLGIDAVGKAVLIGAPYRAVIRSKARLTPERFGSEVVGDAELRRSQELMVEAARRLKAERTQRPRMLQLQGEGEGYDVVGEAMLAAKQAIAGFMAARPEFPVIFRVHAAPEPDVQAGFIRRLGEFGVPTTRSSFDDPRKLTALLDTLQQLVLEEPAGSQRASSLSGLLSEIIESFFTRSRFDTQNLGHIGLGVPAYLELKARDGSGITNQFQLRAAVEPKFQGLSPAEVQKRSDQRNQAGQEQDWLSYKFSFLEMLQERMGWSGREFQGRVHQLRSGEILAEVPGFTKWGAIQPASRRLIDGQFVSLRLCGFDAERMRFSFEVA